MFILQGGTVIWQFRFRRNDGERKLVALGERPLDVLRRPEHLYPELSEPFLVDAARNVAFRDLNPQFVIVEDNKLRGNGVNALCKPK